MKYTSEMESKEASSIVNIDMQAELRTSEALLQCNSMFLGLAISLRSYSINNQNKKVKMLLGKLRSVSLKCMDSQCHITKESLMRYSQYSNRARTMK